MKRLTRPRFNHEFTQFNDRSAFSKHNGEAEASRDTGDLLGLDDKGDSTNLDDLLTSNQDKKGAAGEEKKKSIEILDIEDDYDPSKE